MIFEKKSFANLSGRHLIKLVKSYHVRPKNDPRWHNHPTPLTQSHLSGFTLNFANINRPINLITTPESIPEARQVSEVRSAKGDTLVFLRVFPSAARKP